MIQLYLFVEYWKKNLRRNNNSNNNCPEQRLTNDFYS